MAHLTRRIIVFAVAILNLMLADKHGVMATYACSLNTTGCYKLREVKATWSVAKEECERLGAYLLVPSSDGEEEFIYEYFGEKYDKDIWLGCSDDTQSRIFSCYHESIDINGYRRWADNKPNLDRDLSKQYAVKTKPKDYPAGWEETDQTSELAYVCELPRPQPEQYATQSRTCSSGTYVALSNAATGRPVTNLCADGTPLAVLDPVKSARRCGVACLKKLDCFSFNFINVSGTDEEGRCELLGTVEGTWQEQEGCQYYILQ